MNVLDDRKLQNFGIVQFAHNRRNLMQLRLLRRAPPALACDDLIAVRVPGILAKDQRLNDALLADRIRKLGPLSIPESCSLASQLCSALTALHGKGIVHRDVKPGNVYLLKALGVTIKLIDFGMSKSFLDDTDAITEAGRVIGTPSYMAPEQLLGEAPDPRWDVYGVGLVMWEALVGVPYVKSHKRIEQTFRAVLEREPEAPSRLRGKIPPYLDDLVMRASSADPKQRYDDCAQMKKACDEALKRVVKEL